MIVALALIIVAASAYIAWKNSRPGLLASRCHKQVVVTLKTGTAFSGLLAGVDSDVAVLVSAKSLKPGEGPIPVDGEILIARGDIDFMQRP